MPFYPKNHPKYTEFQERPCKILLFGYMGLGDAFMFQPTLRAMLKAFPFAQLDLVAGTKSQSRAMLERLIAQEGKMFGKIFEIDPKSLSIAELRAKNQMLKSEQYDIIHCTHMTPTPYFTSFILSGTIRMGPKIPWDKWYKPRPNGIFNVAITLHMDHEHETSRHKRVAEEFLQTSIPYFTPYLNLSEAERNFASVFWKQHGLDARFVIGTHFGASHAQHWKKWDDDRFAEVLLRLEHAYNPI
ncbi:MAG TPA: hypothetical protein VGM92_13310, partial [Candidatus Kapabacteria bacterium]